MANVVEDFEVAGIESRFNNAGNVILWLLCVNLKLTIQRICPDGRAGEDEACSFGGISQLSFGYKGQTRLPDR